MRRRSLSRKYVDKLQQRIETLEALNKTNQALANGTAASTNDRNNTPPVNSSAIENSARYAAADS